MSTKTPIPSEQIRQILTLAEMLGEHQNVTHWAISARVAPKGDQIQRLKDGGDQTTRTAERTFQKFDSIWPIDLEWPSDITRPSTSSEDAA
jgi:hypothetical protein